MTSAMASVVILVPRAEVNSAARSAKGARRARRRAPRGAWRVPEPSGISRPFRPGEPRPCRRTAGRRRHPWRQSRRGGFRRTAAAGRRRPRRPAARPGRHGRRRGRSAASGRPAASTAAFSGVSSPGLDHRAGCVLRSHAGRILLRMPILADYGRPPGQTAPAGPCRLPVGGYSPGGLAWPEPTADDHVLKRSIM